MEYKSDDEEQQQQQVNNRSPLKPSQLARANSRKKPESPTNREKDRRGGGNGDKQLTRTTSDLRRGKSDEMDEEEEDDNNMDLPYDTVFKNNNKSQFQMNSPADKQKSSGNIEPEINQADLQFKVNHLTIVNKSLRVQLGMERRELSDKVSAMIKTGSITLRIFVFSLTTPLQTRS